LIGYLKNKNQLAGGGGGGVNELQSFNITITYN